MNPRLIFTLSFLSPVSLAMLVRSDKFGSFAKTEYSLRRDEYFAHPWLLWTSVGTNVCITISYILFIIGISWLADRLKHVPELRRNLWILWTLNIFFLARCVTIVLATLKFWWPLYNISLSLNVVCAATSIPAAIAFVWRSPTLAKNVVRFFDLLASEQSQAEALRKSEDFLERTNQLAGAGGWELDIRSGEASWSNQICRIHGVPPGFKPALQEVLNAYKIEARPLLNAAIALAKTEGKGWDLELPITTLGGSELWVRSVGVAVMHEGKTVRLTGATQDITAIVESRNALKQANERIEIATDSGQIGICDWNILAGELFCNDWMYRLHDLKKTTETTNLEFWTQHIHPDDKKHVIDSLNDAVAGPDPYDSEYRVIWNDSSVHHLRATGLVKRDHRGRAVSMAGANWDVTESRRLTAELAQQHELLRVTLDSICDGVITVDLNRDVTWINPAAERMTGWSTADAAGRPLSKVFQTLNEETRDPAENPLANHLAQGKAVGIAKRTLLVSRNSTEFGIENAAAPIRNNFGELLGNVLIFRDVTEQRRLAAETEHNAKLRLDLKLKDEFLSHVSHELRSPLTSIYSFTSIIADGLAGESTPEQQEYLQIILKNVVQLQAMIEDLLTVTQSREGKLGIELQRVSICNAIEDAMHTAQSAAIIKKIALTAEDCKHLPGAWADPTRLRQVLIILLDNAIKFTPAGGSVTVSAMEKELGLLLVQVADTGCGIPEDKRLLVFENLYQVSGPAPADTSQAGRVGLGLGLHIARSLVARQGGNIWVTEAPAGGSIFNFTLPLFTENCERSADNTPRRRKTDRMIESVAA